MNFGAIDCSLIGVGLNTEANGLQRRESKMKRKSKKPMPVKLNLSVSSSATQAALYFNKV